LGTWLGDTIYKTVKRRRNIALKNLKMTLGKEKTDEELKQIARCSFQNMGKTLVEFLMIPRYSMEELLKFITIENREHFQKATADGGGIIAVSAHIGNWELILQAMVLYDKHITAIAQKFKNHSLDNLVNSYRTWHGGHVVEKEISVWETLRALQKGGCVAILGDQDAGENGVFINFLGIPASVSRGPIMFALRTGAAVLNMFDIRQKNDKHVIKISKPIKIEVSGDLEKDIAVNTAKLTESLEKLIRQYPSQWLWMHNRWKTRPGAISCNRNVEEKPPHNAKKRLLILSDGKPGHYNQSLGIARRLEDVHVEVIQIAFKRKWRDNLLRVSTRLLGNLRIPRGLIKSMLKWSMEIPSASALLSLGNFDAILSTGSSVAAPNLLLGQIMDAKTVVCTRPSPLGIKHFHMAILPAHTRLRRPAANAVMTIGVPNMVTPESVDEAGKRLGEKIDVNGDTVIGLLLGGDDPHYTIPPDMASQLCEVLLDICHKNNVNLALTTSRRTRSESEEMVKSRVTHNNLCCFSVLAGEPQGENPVPGILGISHVIIVTEDSFSMVCEAVSSGKKIILLEVARRKNGHGKRERVYKLLAERGYLRRASLLDLREAIMDFINDSSKPKTLDDAQMAADAMRELIYRC
jgi:KDO2-lipid IV(A) lauroyltransferase